MADWSLLPSHEVLSSALAVVSILPCICSCRSRVDSDPVIHAQAKSWKLRFALLRSAKPRLTAKIPQPLTCWNDQSKHPNPRSWADPWDPTKATAAGTTSTLRPAMYALKCLLSRSVTHELRSVQPRYPLDRRLFHNARRLLALAAPGQKEIEITTLNSKKMNLSLLWLRDHCHCKRCVNKDTMQRSFDTFTVPYDVGVLYNTNKAGLWVEWEDNHVSTYSWDWLFQHRGNKLYPMKRKYWGSEIKGELPLVHYDEIMANDAGVGIWTSKIAEYGFCFVDGCPVCPEKTQELLERIAFIRITHYGGFYDFTSDLTMKDTAYTSLALPAHTDNTYFTDPSGLQMFHLLSHTNGTGGASLLVDGFHCAELLFKADPRAYKILSTYLVQWHASGNKGITITPARKFPVLNLNEDNESHKSLMQVRWNNDDRATMPHQEIRGIKIDEWYEAARLWNSILTDEKNEYWEQLVPGRPLIFDNWRVLHGRSVFTGKRRISGGYINRDDFISRYLNTNLPRKEVLRRIL